MDCVPRIEIDGWNARQPLQDAPSRYLPDRSDYLPIRSTPLLDTCLDPDHEQRFSKTTTALNEPPRPRFWSRIRRSKSEDTFPRITPSDINHRSTPQPAMKASTLVWCPEQKIWLFPREEEAVTEHNEPRIVKNKKRRPISANFLPSPLSWRRQAEEDDGMLCAQLPGHYSLSVYDYHGNSSLQRPSDNLDAYSGSARPVTAIESDERAEGGWMSVASRLSVHQPLR